MGVAMLYCREASFDLMPRTSIAISCGVKTDVVKAHATAVN